LGRAAVRHVTHALHPLDVDLYDYAAGKSMRQRASIAEHVAGCSLCGRKVARVEDHLIATKGAERG